MLRSIRARMTAIFSLSVAVLMLLACGGLVAYARRTAERDAQAALRAAADKISRELRDEDERPDLPHFIQETSEDLGCSDLMLFLLDRNGRMVRAAGDKSPNPAALDGPDFRVARLPVGEQSIAVVFPWWKTERSLRSLTNLLALLGLFVVVLATVGGWILVGRTLSPIARLSRQANAAGVENLQVHLKAPSRDAEIVGLVETLNGLLSRLSETAAAKGRFYSAASHELRTPLQALSGHLELALTRERPQGDYRSAVEEAYRQTRRLIKLTQNLLLLYQLDTSASTPPAEPGDLAAICRDALSQNQPLVEQRGLRLKADLPATASFSAPATHAEVLVRNLVENAVRYACPEGEVAVSLRARPEGLDLMVFNECLLPDGWDPDRLFEPFARQDSSRHAETGGTGLGLAICKAISDANGWELSLRREGAGVAARLAIRLETHTA